MSHILLEYAKHTETNYEDIDKIIDIGESEGNIWLRLMWMGLPDEKDFT